MPKYKKQIGNSGEKAAAAFLKKHKYRILAQNFTALNGELDIVALYKKTLVFVEVKTRTSDLYGEPISAVNAAKMQAVLETAAHFENQYVKHGYLNLSIYFFGLRLKYRKKLNAKRFDVIEVFMTKDFKLTKINHHKGFFDEDTVSKLLKRKSKPRSLF